MRTTSSNKFPPTPSEVQRAIPHLRIDALLRSDDSGALYHAFQLTYNRAILLKLLPAKSGTTRERAKSIRRNAKAINRLRHSNIAKIHGVGIVDRGLCIEMEHAARRNLRQLLDERGVSAAEGLEFAIQLADAIGNLHQAGIVHGRLRPETILVRRADYDFHRKVVLTEVGLLDSDSRHRDARDGAGRHEDGSALHGVDRRKAMGDDVARFGEVLREIFPDPNDPTSTRHAESKNDEGDSWHLRLRHIIEHSRAREQDAGFSDILRLHEELVAMRSALHSQVSSESIHVAEANPLAGWQQARSRFRFGFFRRSKPSGRRISARFIVMVLVVIGMAAGRAFLRQQDTPDSGPPAHEAIRDDRLNDRFNLPSAHGRNVPGFDHQRPSSAHSRAPRAPISSGRSSITPDRASTSGREYTIVPTPALLGGRPRALNRLPGGVGTRNMRPRMNTGEIELGQPVITRSVIGSRLQIEYVNSSGARRIGIDHVYWVVEFENGSRGEALLRQGSLGESGKLRARILATQEGTHAIKTYLEQDVFEAGNSRRKVSNVLSIKTPM